MPLAQLAPSNPTDVTNWIERFGLSTALLLLAIGFIVYLVKDDRLNAKNTIDAKDKTIETQSKTIEAQRTTIEKLVTAIQASQKTNDASLEHQTLSTELLEALRTVSESRSQIK